MKPPLTLPTELGRTTMKLGKASVVHHVFFFFSLVQQSEPMSEGGPHFAGPEISEPLVSFRRHSLSLSLVGRT